MSDRLKCAGQLNQLLESNFLVAKSYRRITKAVEDESLQKFFQKKASKRFQFAIELGEEISFLKESRSSYGPFSPLKRSLGILNEDNLLSLLKKALKNDKRILKQYKKAISEINQASTREILIRHISIIENSIEDLQTLKSVTQMKTDPTTAASKKLKDEIY